MCKIRRLRPLELFLKAPGTDIPEAHPRFSSVLPPISGHSCKTSVVGQRGRKRFLPPVPLHSGGIGTLRDYNPIIDVPNHYWRSARSFQHEARWSGLLCARTRKRSNRTYMCRPPCDLCTSATVTPVREIRHTEICLISVYTVRPKGRGSGISWPFTTVRLRLQIAPW